MSQPTGNQGCARTDNINYIRDVYGIVIKEVIGMVNSHYFVNKLHDPRMTTHTSEYINMCL